MPNSWVGLVVALFATVPGFLATTTWSRARTWKGPSGDLRTILESLAFSVAIQVAISPLTLLMIYPIRDELVSHPRRVMLWALIAVLVTPLLTGVVTAKASDVLFPPTARPWAESASGWRRLLYRLVRPVPPPSVWDMFYLVNAPHGKFVSLQFTDGTQVGGVFSEGSVAMTTPDPHGLFLAEEWVLDEDGNFREPVANSGGILIRKLDDVRWVRIQSGSGDDAD